MPILAAHHLILLHSRDRMLNDDSPLRQSPIPPLLAGRQWMMLTWLLRQFHSPLRIMFGQAHISLVGSNLPVVGQGGLHPGALKQTQVVGPPTDALRHMANPAVGQDRHLHLARMPLLLARIAMLALGLVLRAVYGLFGGINNDLAQLWILLEKLVQAANLPAALCGGRLRCQVSAGLGRHGQLLFKKRQERAQVAGDVTGIKAEEIAEQIVGQVKTQKDQGEQGAVRQRQAEAGAATDLALTVWAGQALGIEL